MRIAHVITRLILGGAQENTVLCCEDLLRDYGDDVLLITGPALGPEGSLIERARAGGLPLVVVPQMRRAIRPWRDLISYQGIKRELAAFKPDVVHTHSGKAGLLGRMAAHRLKVPAIVHTVHGAPFHSYQNGISRAFFRACERFAARRCDRLVSVSSTLTQQLIAAQVAPPDKFVTIYSGMEVDDFLNSDALRDDMRRQLGYTNEHVVIGKVARLFHLKGHEFVIRAAQRIVAECPQARFLFVGDGVLRQRLQRQIERSGLGRYFQFTGLAQPSEIPRLLAAMDVVVHASLREGLARVLPQALLSGKPVVTFNIDGARDVVIPSQTGFLMPPQRVPALAEAIKALVVDPALRERMGSEGRRRFGDQFRHQRMTAELRQLYQSILTSKQATN